MAGKDRIQVAVFYAGLKDKKDSLQLKTIDNRYEGYIRAIHCRMINFLCLRIGQKKYAAIIDNDGLRKKDMPPSSIDYEGGTMADISTVGNLIICKDGRNRFDGISKADYKNIKEYIRPIEKNGKKYQVLVSQVS